MDDLDVDKRYKCPDCGHVCAPDDMDGDYYFTADYEDEIWSNWICPECKAWHGPNDWEVAP